MRKRNLLVIVGVLALGLASILVLGTAMAQEPTQTQGTLYERFVSKLAGALGVTEDRLRLAMKQAGQDVVKGEVDAGRLSKQQGDRLQQRLDQGNIFPFSAPGAKSPQSLVTVDRNQTVQIAAQTLGMSVDDLQAQLQQGKSIADVAKEKGVDPQRIIDARVAKARDNVNQMVKDGKLTQAQADQAIQNLPDQVKRQVEAKGTGVAAPRGLGGMMLPVPGLWDDAAQFLGISRDDLNAQLQGGKSLVEIAQARGKSKQDLINFLVGKAKERLQQRVDQLTQQLPSLIDQFVEAKPPAIRQGLRGVPQPFSRRGAPMQPQGPTQSPGTNLPIPHPTMADAA
ncbi:MAG: hypothetical protein HYX89_01150 [Chloroflexi bacterium]|nr:hypothetical protein [Chloroflexota bacterium]